MVEVPPGGHAAADVFVEDGQDGVAGGCWGVEVFEEGLVGAESADAVVEAGPAGLLFDVELEGFVWGKAGAVAEGIAEGFDHEWGVGRVGSGVAVAERAFFIGGDVPAPGGVEALAVEAFELVEGEWVGGVEYLVGAF